MLNAAHHTNLDVLLQEKAKAVLRRQMKHVMFTEPEVIEAGKPVTVYYCPDDTVLAGSRWVCAARPNLTLGAALAQPLA